MTLSSGSIAGGSEEGERGETKAHANFPAGRNFDDLARRSSRLYRRTEGRDLFIRRDRGVSPKFPSTRQIEYTRAISRVG